MGSLNFMICLLLIVSSRSCVSGFRHGGIGIFAISKMCMLSLAQAQLGPNGQLDRPSPVPIDYTSLGESKGSNVPLVCKINGEDPAMLYNCSDLFVANKTDLLRNTLPPNSFPHVGTQGRSDKAGQTNPVKITCSLSDSNLAKLALGPYRCCLANNEETLPPGQCRDNQFIFTMVLDVLDFEAGPVTTTVTASSIIREVLRITTTSMLFASKEQKHMKEKQDASHGTDGRGLIVGVTLGIIVVLTGIFVGLFIYHRRRHASSHSVTEPSIEPKSSTPNDYTA